MKKSLAAILCFVIVFFAFGINTFASDDDISLCFNNVANTNSGFYITDTGLAVAYAGYNGYSGVINEARVTITLQKRNLLFFWKDVVEWVDVSYEDIDSFEHTYQLSKGTYRAQIHFEISGTNGTTDVVDDEYKETY